MAKKILALTLVMLMLLLMAACDNFKIGSKKTECEICGETARCSKISDSGESCYICSDCEDLTIRRTECEICGDTAWCIKVSVFGEKYYICSDCKTELEEWGLLD